MKFLIKDEKGRVFLTSMVSCLFARSVYNDEVLSNCLKSIGYGTLADNMDAVAGEIQRLRWKLRVMTGYRPENVSIPKRFTEITTWKGQIDSVFLSSLKDQYASAIRDLAGTDTTASTSEKKEGQWHIENTT